METTMSLWQADQPYNQLPLLPPQASLETIEVLKQCITARAALGELKQAAFRIPNQAMLINILPLLEAKASSEIENIVTSTDRLFRNVGSEANADPATKEALRYSRALFDGYAQLRADNLLTTRTIERICSTIKGVDMSVRKVPGTKLTNAVTGEIVYTPPEGEKLLRDLLKNWEDFIHAESDLDPLIRLAIAHYQFEAIHPFSDGNGRTGRIVNSLFLIQQDLLSLPILYLSRYVIDNRADYYRLLQGVTTAGDWQAWVLYVIKGIEETALWTTAKIDAIFELERHTAVYVRKHLPKIYSHELITLIFKLPYCRINDLVEAGIAKRQTASIYLTQLIEKGILSEVENAREKLFLHTKLYDLLSTENNSVIPYDVEDNG
jgi:Fic family protein